MKLLKILKHIIRSSLQFSSWCQKTSDYIIKFSIFIIVHIGNALVQIILICFKYRILK